MLVAYLPYVMSDQCTSFATVPLEESLSESENPAARQPITISQVDWRRIHSTMTS